MAEPQEGRIEDTNSGSNTTQNSNQGNSGSQNASTSGSQVVSKVENALGVESGKTQDIYRQAKETAGQALGQVSEKATTQIDEKKVTLARGLSSVADNIRQMGENLRGTEDETPIAAVTAKYGDSLASQVEQVSTYLEQKDLREVLKDVERFARRNPAVFLGGAFALGLLASRFLKSSGRNASGQALKSHSRFEEDGLHMPADLEEQLEETDNQPFKFGDSGTGSTTSKGSSGSTNF